MSAATVTATHTHTLSFSLPLDGVRSICHGAITLLTPTYIPLANTASIRLSSTTPPKKTWWTPLLIAPLYLSTHMYSKGVLNKPGGECGEKECSSERRSMVSNRSFSRMLHDTIYKQTNTNVSQRFTRNNSI